MSGVATEGDVTEVRHVEVDQDAFAHVETWVFDLDDTLYPRSVGLHDQMKTRVVLFIADHMKIDPVAAEAVHVDYYQRFGATLQGLVELHGVAPQSFLEFVHDIDLSALTRNDELIAALRALPGRRVVFTISSQRHATAALDAMGMTGLFDAICSIEDSAFVGKPQHSAYAKFLSVHGIDPQSSVMFEDRIGNLVVLPKFGMRTVLIVERPEGVESTLAKPSFVDVIVADLATFLRDIAVHPAASRKSDARTAFARTIVQ